jgi:flagellar hook assembly protein FlgD
VYNSLGQKVKSLLDRDFAAGRYSTVWDGRDSHGSEVASGVYFYRLVSGGEVITKKMLLLK